MKKRNAIIALIVMVVVLAGLGYTTIFGLGADKSGSMSDIKLGLDLAGGVSITYQVAGEQNPTEEDMNDTIYKLQKRVEQYSTEAQVYKEGSDRINIEIPGVSDANKVLEELGRPGSLYFIRQTDESGNANYQYDATIGDYALTRDLADVIATGDAVLSGTDVADAQAGYNTDSMNNQEIVVSLTFTTEGAKKFADATTKAYAAGESIGIYYDGSFISVPRVNAAITNGQAIITGEESIDSADNLASTIRIGGLKVELEELRSNVVGAQLGQEAISTSLKAGAIGLILVIIFMIAVYFLPGFAASLALLLYTELMILILSAFDVTLTLPGIAGILLSIGMAVDANVVIFARIREELATGKTVKSAMKIGYDKALSAIIDGNVTTLIAALVLGLKGSGSVKGFAQTLAIGIVLSMFTALFVTRFLMRALYGVGLQSEKLYGVGKERKPVNFLAKKNIFFACSAAVILAGFVGMAVHHQTSGSALNYSLDFVGGTSTNINFKEDMSLSELESTAVPIFEKVTGDANVQIQKVAGGNQVIFKTRTLGVTEREDLDTQIEEQFGVSADKITSETISSTISKEMKSDALVAVIIALACMLIYIWFRFKDLRFGASAVIALGHDVLVVLACYALLRVSVGSTFIACMLTIVGYSINATIVIFDRVRENLKMHSKDLDLAGVINLSVTQTLSRSIFSSLTTFFMVFVLFILGVSSIREFALPIMVGIVSGTYSSVCLAGAFYYLLRKKFAPKTPSQPQSGKSSSDAQKKAAKKKSIEEKNKAKITV